MPFYLHINVESQITRYLFIKFDPDLVIISAGYDAALGCPEVITNSNLSLSFYLSPQLCSLTLTLFSCPVALIRLSGTRRYPFLFV